MTSSTPRDRVDRDITAVEQRRHPAIVVRVAVRDDDGGKRLLQRVDARAERSPVRNTERRVNDDDAGARLDEIGIDGEKAGFETMNGDV